MFSSLHQLSVGIIGFGAFGRLIARHLAPHVSLRACDPVWPAAEVEVALVRRGTLAEAAACDIVILAVPVARLAEVAAQAAPHLRPGTLVLDVGSVKLGPVADLMRELPAHVDILATHPLFGPQSARNRLAGHKIVLCPVRGRHSPVVKRFLRQTLGLKVVLTTPEQHDRDLATVQGLTHLIGRLVGAMGTLPTELTTRSFELLVEAAGMVTGDTPEVFDAILHANPHAPALRRRFFDAAAKLAAELEESAGGGRAAPVAREPALQPQQVSLPVP